MFKSITAFAFCMCYVCYVWAFQVGDYRTTSNPSLDWADTTKWETYNGSTWVAASAAPTHTAEAIYINHSVWIFSATTADQIIVNTGGDLRIYANLMLNDGVGDDLTQNGGDIILFTGIYVNGIGSPKIMINSGATFQWAANNLGLGISVEVASGATLLVAGGSDKLNEASVTNYGTIEWSAYNLSVPFASTNSGTIHNYGTFNITSDNGGSNSCFLFGQHLYNHTSGTINISLPTAAPTGTVYFQESGGGAAASFNNDGLVNIIQGRLNNFATGTCTGTYNVSANGQLDFWTSVFTFNGATFAGTGAVKKYADWILASDISIANPFLYWGNGLSGNFSLNVLSNATLYSCFIATGTTLRIAPTGVLTVQTSGSREHHGTIKNEGTVHWEEGQITNNFVSPQGYIQNFGTWNISPTGSDIFYYGLYFTNDSTGIINKNNSYTWYFANYISGGFSTAKNSQLWLNAGTFDLSEIGTHEGYYYIETGANLSLGVSINYLADTLSNKGTIANNPIVMAGSQAQTLKGEGLIHRLSINNANHLTLKDNHTVSLLLDLTLGNLILGDYDLFLTNGNTQNASNNSYILTNGIGTLRSNTAPNTTLLFPVGTSTSYTPASLFFLPAHQSDIFSVRCFDELYSHYDSADNPIGAPLSNACVKRTWIIDEDIAGASFVDISTYWQVGEEAVGFNRTGNVALGHYNGTYWDIGAYQAAIASGSFYYVSRNNVNAFSPFGVANGSALPIELLNFDGNIQDTDVLLKWQTATELNADKFDIERSVDGHLFEKIGEVKAKGYSQQIEDYQFTDISPIFGKNYYRLKNIDIDGSHNYSNIIAINYHNIINNIYPNPFYDNMQIFIQYQQEETVKIQVQNTQGQIVFTENYLLSKGTNLITLPLQELAAGIYTLSIKSVFNHQSFIIIKE